MAQLTAMRYKDYVWPHNPRIYTEELRREAVVRKIPMGAFHVQDLGAGHRVFRGEGEFVGEDAYAQFQKLSEVFREDGPGMLVHPVRGSVRALFTELTLRQEPRRDYVRYTFTFLECRAEESSAALREVTAPTGAASASTGASSGGAVWYTVKKGDTLWGISRKYGVKLAAVIALNPGIKNPNLIYPGEKVRVK